MSLDISDPKNSVGGGDYVVGILSSLDQGLREGGHRGSSPSKRAALSSLPSPARDGER